MALEVPELIFLNVDLPDMTGLEVYRRLKAGSVTSTVPVLILTDASVESVEFAHKLEQGDEAFLTCPVEEVELLSFVNTFICGQQAQRRLNSFSEAGPEAVVIVDASGRIVRGNRQTEKMFGYLREELIGKMFEILLPVRLRDVHKNHRARFMLQPSIRPMGASLDLRGLRKDGTEVSIEIRLSPIPDHDGSLCAYIVRDNTERRRAEDVLRVSEQRQRSLLDSIPQKIATTKPNGDVDYLNPQWIKYTGLGFDQIRDRGWKQVIHPDDLADHVRAWHHSVATGEEFEFESRFRRFDGEYRWHVSRAAPIRDEFSRITGWVGSNTDIHYLKQTEAALHVTETRFRRLFETAKDGVVILDTNSKKITEVNPFICQLLGYSHEHFLGKELWEIGLFTNKSANEGAVRELQQRGYLRFEHLPLETSRGQRVEVEIVANSYQEGDHSVIQCNIRDITERNRLESQLRQQAIALEDLHRRKDEFLAMLSHELRNPLSPIASALQLLSLQKNEGPLQLRARTIIERQVGQLTRLIDDLLEVSRITTGRIHLQQERTKLNEVIENAVETVRPLIVRHKHELTVSLSPSPIWVFADAARLEQVIVNLLTNATKFTADGGKISLTSRQIDDECVIRVRDNGIGIAPEVLPCVFDLFTQAERSLDRSQGGLGIGLALVQRIVEMHGGQVEVFSTIGEGSEFVVHFPAMPTPAHQPPQVHVDPAHLKPRSLRVLVVDDNEDAAQMLGMILSEDGNNVLITHDGPTTLEVAATFRPEVVLLDIGLPGLDGYEVAAKLREQVLLQDVVLVAMTGYGQDSDRRRSASAGFNHHLVKPPDFTKLKQILASVAEKRPFPVRLDVVQEASEESFPASDAPAY